MEYLKYTVTFYPENHMVKVMGTLLEFFGTLQIEKVKQNATYH